MEELLFLAHRIPYPPNKGDKIRSWHMLKHLARSYRIHLGAFIDTPADWRYVDDVSALCVDTCFRKLDPLAARLRSLRGLLTGQPLTQPYYYDNGMQRWVEKKLAHTGISHVFVFSSSMAQYVSGAPAAGKRCIVDFVDVDSDKWRQYSRGKRWPANWLYRRESERLLAFEREVSCSSDAVTFVSAQEAALFERLAPEAASRVNAIDNGVDHDYFSPELDYENPYDSHDRVLVFTGAMDYWANVDAVCWFARSILPRIQESVPSARFAIVGARPAREVRRLASLPGVMVTGSVTDIRPYLAHARAAVAPLRIARGVQNKVLEAMAMAKPVLATSAAMEGIEFSDPGTLRVADSEQQLVEQGISLLADDKRQSADTARQWVCRRYDWESNLDGLCELLAGRQREQRPVQVSARVTGGRT